MTKKSYIILKHYPITDNDFNYLLIFSAENSFDVKTFR